MAGSFIVYRIENPLDMVVAPSASGLQFLYRLALQSVGAVAGFLCYCLLMFGIVGLASLAASPIYMIGNGNYRNVADEYG